MSGLQTLLVIVVVTLTLLLVVVGLQVILILADLRKSVKRLNTVLEDSVIGGGLIRPEKLTGVLQMFRKKKRLEEKGNYQGKTSDTD